MRKEQEENKEKIWKRENKDIIKIGYTIIDDVFTFYYKVYYENLNSLENSFEAGRLMIGMSEIFHNLRNMLPEKAFNPLTELTQDIRFNFEEEFFMGIGNNKDLKDTCIDIYESTYHMLEGLYDYQ